MNPNRVLSGRQYAEILDYAVREHALAVITIHEDDWKTFKCRFLERDANRRFFVLDHEPFQGKQLPDLTPGMYTGISFRHKNRKIMFATVVEARGRFALDEKTSVVAVRYRWPESVTELQRRAYYRTPVPAGTNLMANLWPGGVRARAASQNRTLSVSTGQVLDLSCGGTFVRLAQTTPPAWTADQTIGIELFLPDGRSPLTVDAYYRGTRPDSEGNLCVAVQFVGLELAVDGPLVLQRLNRCVQRLHRLNKGTEPRSSQSRFQG